MTIKKLSAMPYAQAHTEHFDNGDIALVSYVTVVATLTNEGWLTVHGLYSNTTRRHISAFMKEYTGLDYYTAKQCYTDNHRINIHTGEIEEIG